MLKTTSFFKGTSGERASTALITMGMPVINGAMTTFLSLVIMNTASLEPFVYFFKVFGLMVIFGLFHGLFFLPVMMSLVGSTNEAAEEKHSLMKATKATPLGSRPPSTSMAPPARKSRPSSSVGAARSATPAKGDSEGGGGAGE